MQAAPARLIGTEGLCPFGNYAGAIADVNADDFDFTVLERGALTLFGPTARRFFKRWQFVGAVDERFVIGVAVAHVQYLANGFVYVYDRTTGHITQVGLKLPLALGCRFSRSAAVGATEMRKGDALIRMDNTLRGVTRHVEVDFGDELRVTLRYDDPGVGVSTLCPQDGTGFHYCYKTAGLPLSGHVTLGGVRHELGEEALGLLDWTASTPPRKTTWNWACGAGQASGGGRVGLNFSRGLVGGPYTQNAVWIDGEPIMLPPVNFIYDPQDITGIPWRITAQDGSLDLIFRPEQERFEDIELGLVASRLHQPFGSFRGFVKKDGRKIALAAYGFCEEHYAKW